MASADAAPLVCDVSEQPFDVAFHPSARLVAAGLVSGRVELFGYSATACGPVTSHAAHAAACRAVRFVAGGAALASGGADRALLLRDVATGATLAAVAGAHEAAINRLERVAERVLASGARHPLSPASST